MPFFNLNDETIKSYSLSQRDLVNFNFELEELKSAIYNKNIFKNFNCEICNKELDIENIVASRSNHLYCRECAENMFCVCPICGNINEKDAFFYVEDINKKICKNCISQLRVKTCNYCNKLFKEYKKVEFIGAVCSNCYHDHKCFKCLNCDRHYNEDRFGRDSNCITCANNRVENCRNYTYKPRPNFFQMPDENNEYNLFYGVELEMGDAESYISVMKFISNSMGGLFYAKRDASIPAYGCEVVSHPATCRYHVETNEWDRVLKQAKKYELKSDELDKCGVHVHISRNALSSKECAMLDFFVNKKKDFWKKIARRESHYSTYLDKETSCWGRQISDRHCAVNLFNAYTIEIRIFKGTLSEKYIKSYIEICDALVHFIKTYHNDIDLFEKNNNIENDFIKYFMESDKYLNLKKYFENIFL